MSSVISTSRTDARIVTVWSSTIATWIAGGIEASSCGIAARIRSTVSIIFEHRWLAVGEPLITHVLHRVDHVGDIGQAHGRAIVVLDNQRLVLIRLEQLI